jgi:dihydrofolate reductase
MQRTTEYKMIVALCRGGGIGYKGQLPWPKLSRDMRFFAEMTSSSVVPHNSAVIMGSKTWNSLPESSKPLKSRDNLIISNSKFISENVDADSVTSTPDVRYIRHLNKIQEHTLEYDVAWIIGGASIYEQVIFNNTFNIDEIYITFVDELYEFDTIFPLTYQYNTIDEILQLRNNLLNRKVWSWSDADNIPNYISFDTDEYYSVEDVDRNIISRLTRDSDIIATKERRVPNLRFLKLKRLLLI